MTERIIATVTDYAGLVAALRSWTCELDTTLSCVDDVAGFPERYCAKLLAPRPMKGLSRVSLGALLGALGLRLNVVVDPDALAKVRQRLLPSKWTPNRHATERRKLMEAAAASAQDAHACGQAFLSEWGRRAQAAKMLKTSPEVRQRQASSAANARWKAARRRIREAAAEAARAPA